MDKILLGAVLFFAFSFFACSVFGLLAKKSEGEPYPANLFICDGRSEVAGLIRQSKEAGASVFNFGTGAHIMTAESIEGLIKAFRADAVVFEEASAENVLSLLNIAGEFPQIDFIVMPEIGFRL